MQKWTYGLGLLISATFLLTSKMAPAQSLHGHHAKFHGMHHRLGSYVSLSKAVQDLNQSIFLARANPMDDWRRDEVKRAKQELDVRSVAFAAEVGKGNLDPSDIETAKTELSLNVDLGNLIVEINESSSAERGIAQEAAPSEDSGRTVMEDNGKASLGADAGNSVYVDTTSIEMPVLATGQTVSDSPSQAAPAGSSSIQLLAGPLEKLANIEGLAFSKASPSESSSGRIAAKSPLAFGERGDRATKSGPAHFLNERVRQDQSGTVEFAPSKSGAARLAAVKAAVTKLRPHQSVGALVASKGSASLHVSGFLPGGPVITGDFGEGIVAVQLEAGEEGYEAITLSRGQLWKLYAELAFYWALILIPVLYGCFRWGMREASTRTPQGTPMTRGLAVLKLIASPFPSLQVIRRRKRPV